ncbi:MAG: enolase [Thaumarchaeota archaeon]|nr:enolase [Nitrososphaerota archaeon]
MAQRYVVKDVKARLCYNSRGDPTIEADVTVGDSLGRAMAPAGASVGKYEAQALPQGGVKEAIRLLGQYKRRLIGLDTSDPYALNDELRKIDGTDNYSKIGGSTAFALTVAAADGAAKAKRVPLFKLLSPKGPHYLPRPIGNVLGGGKHAGKATPDIQEFLVCATGAKNILDAVRANTAVHKDLGKRLEKTDPNFTGGKGDEGAWAPRLKNDEALEVVYDSVRAVSDSTGIESRMGLDVASSSFWDEKKQIYDYSRSGVKRSAGEQVDYIVKLVNDYRLIYVEDPLHEEDFEGFAELTKKIKVAYVVGDDLLVTSPEKLRKAAGIGACNACILKVNQAGGLGDALRFAEAAREAKFTIITSHRSGDTAEAHIAHVAVATGSKMLKTGVVGGERIAKLNELIRISELDEATKMTSVDFQPSSQI